MLVNGSYYREHIGLSTHNSARFVASDEAIFTDRSVAVTVTLVPLLNAREHGRGVVTQCCETESGRDDNDRVRADSRAAAAAEAAGAGIAADARRPEAGSDAGRRKRIGMAGVVAGGRTKQNDRRE